MSLQTDVWKGIGDIVAGLKGKDDKRFRRGQETVNKALAETIPATDHALIQELDEIRMDLWKIAVPHLPNDAISKFAVAITEHQNILSKLAGGEK